MEENKETKEQVFVELDEINVIMKIPKEAVKLDVTAYIINDDCELTRATKILKADDIRKMRQDFLDYVEDGDDYDAQYVITDKGIEFLEQLEKQRHDKIHCVCD